MVPGIIEALQHVFGDFIGEKQGQVLRAALLCRALRMSGTTTPSQLPAPWSATTASSSLLALDCASR